ncbi:hypothetical protein EWI07_03915 [Sporolactobacillus sp. THM7-4]|nr:hypothetical protein EWI07_03915 [Sporolactobacillus sp. THM7-4]
MSQHHKSDVVTGMERVVKMKKSKKVLFLKMGMGSIVLFLLIFQSLISFSGGTAIAQTSATPRLSPSQIKVTNNYGKSDTIYVSHLKKGDVIRVYNSAGKWLKTQTSRGTSTTLYIKQLGTYSGKLSLTITHPYRKTSGKTPVSYYSEYSARLSTGQVRVTNNYGKSDTIYVSHLKKGDVIRVYNSAGKWLKTQTSKGTSTTLYIKQLGTCSGKLSLTVNHPYRRISGKTPVSYYSEYSARLSTGQVRVTNNYGKSDTVYVSHLKKGDVIRVYHSSGKWLKTQTSKGTSTTLYIKQLGAQAGRLSVTVAHPYRRPGGKLTVPYGAELSAPLQASQIEVTNNRGSADTIYVGRLKKGDVIRVYNAKGQGLASVKSAGSSVTASVDQLGEMSGKIYLTVTHSGQKTSSKTAVTYKSEPILMQYQTTLYDYKLSDASDKQAAAGAQTDKKYKMYISASALKVSGSTGTVTGTWNVRGGPGTNYWIITQVSNGQTVKIINKINSWYQINFSTFWVNAAPSDVFYYLNPTNFNPGSTEYFQFLKLSGLSGIDANETNEKILTSKRGILAGKAATFIQAAREQNINEIYLIAHALLETGNGSSNLANGILVKSVDGKPVAPETVYNMFGIGAVDSNPEEKGAEYAYKQGWFTPEEAILGGARFIGDRYINNQTWHQDTLYKMRWNPAVLENGNPAHEYASDIGWAVKQTTIIKELYDLLTSYSLTFDTPKYKN